MNRFMNAQPLILAALVGCGKSGANDSLDTFQAKLRDLGIPEAELDMLGFALEELPKESTGAPAGLIYAN